MIHAPRGSVAHQDQQAGVCDETLALLRRLRIQYRRRPHIYRDLLTLTAIADAGRDGSTEIGETGHPQGSSVLTVQQAAAVAGVKPVTIYRAISEGRLTATTRYGRKTITAEDLAVYQARTA